MRAKESAFSLPPAPARDAAAAACSVAALLQPCRPPQSVHPPHPRDTHLKTALVAVVESLAVVVVVCLHLLDLLVALGLVGGGAERGRDEKEVVLEPGVEARVVGVLGRVAAAGEGLSMSASQGRLAGEGVAERRPTLRKGRTPAERGEGVSGKHRHRLARCARSCTMVVRSVSTDKVGNCMADVRRSASA